MSAPPGPGPGPKPVRLKHPLPSLGDVQKLIRAATGWAFAHREVATLQFAVHEWGPTPKLTVSAAAFPVRPTVERALTFEVEFDRAAARDPAPSVMVRRKLDGALAEAKRHAARWAELEAESKARKEARKKANRQAGHAKRRATLQARKAGGP